jgi:hypothetical protein
MTKYLVLYLTSASAGEQMASATPEQTKTSMDAWMAWNAKAGSAVADLGAPLMHATTVPSGSSPRGGLHVGGYSLMQADSVESLRATLADHPHLLAPAGAIEVHEILSMPGM